MQSPHGPEIVGGVTRQLGEIVAKSRVGLGATQAGDELIASEPPPARGFICDQARYGFAVHRHGDVFARLDAPKQTGGAVAEFTRSDLRRATTVAPA